jgi:hypothetical protein
MAIAQTTPRLMAFVAPLMAFRPLLPALAPERQALPPLATVSILNALEPVAAPLRGCLPELSSAEAQSLDGLLERLGSAVVFRGHPVAARAVEARLRRAGLTTSLNWLAGASA